MPEDHARLQSPVRSVLPGLRRAFFMTSREQLEDLVSIILCLFTATQDRGIAMQPLLYQVKIYHNQLLNATGVDIFSHCSTIQTVSIV